MENFHKISAEAKAHNAQLIAVSKMQSIEKIKSVYDMGQRDFGENKVQEILLKKPQLPDDIHWHLIGKLQSNKVKKIIDQVAMIQSVDSEKLMNNIQKEAAKREIKIDVLLQIRIAEEESKSGMTKETMLEIIQKYLDETYPNIQIKGLMGITTLTDDQNQISKEFEYLKKLHEECQNAITQATILSMGMSSDYMLALEKGSSMIRVGSSIFGMRN